MEEVFTDILVIGSGLAGITSALEAEKSGLRVLLLGKFAIGMGTNTSLASAFGAANSCFSKEDHFRATMEAGKGLNQLNLVKVLVEQGPDALERLKAYGIPLIESGTLYRLDCPAHSSQLPGVLLMRTLTERVRASTIQVLPGLTIFDLVVEEGEVRGAFGFFRDGRPFLIHSRSVILATGGGGAIYRRNDNQKSILGDGYMMALRAGLPLYDLEFVQFYPFVLAEPSLSTFILFPPYPRGTRLITERGEDLLVKLGIREDLDNAIRAERDRLSVFLYETSQSVDIYCDLTQVPAEAWDLYPLNFLKKSRFPFRDRPFLILPAVHFLMGGIGIDEAGRTGLPGLFAAGEVAWGVHGANRLGGNAVTECAVFGILAGRSAAAYAGQREGRTEGAALDAEATQKRWERKARAYTRKKRGVFDRPRDLLRDLKNLAWKYAGPVREEGSLREGLDLLTSLEKKMERVYPASLKDLFVKRDLEGVALLLKAILKGSQLRAESRGCFFRKDFRGQDDRGWQKNTCYRLEKGELQITHRPVSA